MFSGKNRLSQFHMGGRRAEIGRTRAGNIPAAGAERAAFVRAGADGAAFVRAGAEGAAFVSLRFSVVGGPPDAPARPDNPRSADNRQPTTVNRQPTTDNR
jgi:hypothetical protein